MPRRTRYEVGAPCWVDRITARPVEIERFYTDLFGWHYESEGRYRMALLGKDIVAGIGSAASPREFWTVYLAAKDLDAAARAIVATGGRVILEPLEISGVGTLLLALDPVGTLLGFWSGNTAEGVVLADETGTACRYELRVPNPAGLAAFYSSVGLRLAAGGGQFGLYAAEARSDTDAGEHALVDVVADPDGPAELLPFFGVTDLPATVRAALSRGARIARPGADGSVGLRDPLGAGFGLQQVAA